MAKDITDLDARVVLAFADNNMNATETGKKLFMYRTTVKYHLERVGAKTGLSPLKFYDLVKLVGILKETEGIDMATYIEREAIEYPYLYMSMWGLNSSTCKAYNEGVKAAADAIAAIPAADVEPVKHGRWVQPKSGECFCSECKTLGSPQWKRCPVCEAKMTTE